MTSFIVHSNNYYCVDLVVSNANALVTFESELPSDIPNPQFIARAGATNRVVLLLGKPYEVKCAQPIVCVETSHSDVEVMERYEGCLEICRPVICEFVSLPLLMASPLEHGLFGLGGGGMTLSLSPEPEGYEVSLGACCCMMQSGSGLPYFYCMGHCGCGGCSSGDISVTYDGTALAFPGYSCPCSHEPNPGGDDPQEDPDGPSVLASFSHEAVIFEEAYTNMPDVVVPRRSTDVEVSYYVNGGTNGGTYAFTLVNGANCVAHVAYPSSAKGQWNESGVDGRVAFVIELQPIEVKELS